MVDTVVDDSPPLGAAAARGAGFSPISNFGTDARGAGLPRALSTREMISFTKSDTVSHRNAIALGTNIPRLSCTSPIISINETEVTPISAMHLFSICSGSRSSSSSSATSLNAAMTVPTTSASYGEDVSAPPESEATDSPPTPAPGVAPTAGLSACVLSREETGAVAIRIFSNVRRNCTVSCRISPYLSRTSGETPFPDCSTSAPRRVVTLSNMRAVVLQSSSRTSCAGRASSGRVGWLRVGGCSVTGLLLGVRGDRSLPSSLKWYRGASDDSRPERPVIS
mmetsp:Transcript_30148/g.84221  ORF Transcript_30148/g.84221 Transcript_30148/m.84221 type:complete len:281 (-) Transcript_30148:328-1170(-)